MNISKSPIDHRRPSSPDYPLPQPHGPAPPIANGSNGPVKKRKRIDRPDQEYENGHRGLQRTADYSPPLDPSPVSPRTMIGTMALSSLAEAVSQAVQMKELHGDTRAPQIDSGQFDTNWHMHPATSGQRDEHHQHRRPEWGNNGCEMYPDTSQEQLYSMDAGRHPVFDGGLQWQQEGTESAQQQEWMARWEERHGFPQRQYSQSEYYSWNYAPHTRYPPPSHASCYGGPRAHPYHHSRARPMHPGSQREGWEGGAGYLMHEPGYSPTGAPTLQMRPPAGSPPPNRPLLLKPTPQRPSEQHKQTFAGKGQLQGKQQTFEIDDAKGQPKCDSRRRRQDNLTRFTLVDETAKFRRYEFRCPNLDCPNCDKSMLTPWLVSSSNKFRCTSAQCKTKKQKNNHTIPAHVMRQHLIDVGGREDQAPTQTHNLQ